MFLSFPIFKVVIIIPLISLKNFFFFVCVGSSLLHGLLLASESRGHSQFVGCGLLIAVASLVVEPRLSAHGLQ